VIDEGLPDEWPPEVIEAINKFEQGHLIKAPALSYAARLSHPIWDLTRQEAEAEPDTGDVLVQLAVDESDRPPFGIITTQTCDIAEDRPEPCMPWIQVSPVYACSDDDPLLGRDYVQTLDALQPPEPGKRWVADLRLECPLEKSALVDREPIDPFPSEAERIAFGRLLGERRARAALAESIHEFVSETMKKHKRQTGKRVGKRVYKILLEIEGQRIEPQAVRVHVITVPGQGIDDEEIQEWFDSWWDEARLRAEEHGVNLLKTRFHKATSMDVSLYDSLAEIRCPLH
jgi:hypothetical protein